MKKIFIFLTGVLALGFTGSCTKEPAELNLQITVDKTTYVAGEEVIFNISGKSDFLTFYNGLEGSKYEDYPQAGNESVPYNSKSLTFSKKYNNFNGQVTATFIATSYGNWGEDEKIQQFNFTLDIKDNRTSIISCVLKTAGLFGKEFQGVVNEDNTTITVSVPTGTNISKLTTSLITESPLSLIYFNDVVFKNKSTVDFSAGVVIFEVVAADGTTQNWSVQVVFI